MPGGENMPHVESTARIPVEADTLWVEVGSFQSIGAWHPMLASVRGKGEQPGALRTAKSQDGQEQVERLEAVDPAQYFYRYAMVSSPMPVSGYVGELRVRNNNDGTSTVLWTSDFTVNSGDEMQTAGMVRDFFAAGLENLKKKYH
jgi:Polyketide cyclase / dehydrase and lipid transport